MSRPAQPEIKKPKHIEGSIPAIWDELSAQVRPSIGAVGMEALCLQVSRMRDARSRIDKESLVVADRNGNPVPHPAIAIERAAGAEVRAWLKQYARTR